MEALKKYHFSVFALVLLCFLLPFINVFSFGQRLASLTGIQLTFGVSIEQANTNPFQRSQPKKDEGGELFAMIAFGAAILGLLLSFQKKRFIGPAIMAGLGLASIIALKIKIDNDVLRELRGRAQLEYAVGFILAAILYLMAFCLYVYLVKHKE